MRVGNPYNRYPVTSKPVDQQKKFSIELFKLDVAYKKLFLDIIYGFPVIVIVGWCLLNKKLPRVKQS